ncbi:MAG: hypothetical protein ACFB22_09910 [Rhodothalassiaceae bacterium]
MIADLGLDPLVPLWALAVIALIALAPVVFALARGARGAWVRMALALALIGVLAGPVLVREDLAALKNVVLLVEDHSRSMDLPDRAAQAEQAGAAVAQALAAQPDIDVDRLSLGQSREGTALFGPLSAALAELDPRRLAGVVILSDGQIHDDPDQINAVPAPVHGLIAGDRGLPDRMLATVTAPSYGVVDRPTEYVVRVVDNQVTAERSAEVTIKLDGETVLQRRVLPGRDVSLPVTPERRGPMVVEIEVSPAPGERFTGNNRVVHRLNAVRDRLKVLLISGEPHAGERVWRQALKADPSVDLVHFTILRLPQSQDQTPENELSLIPFPRDELFRDRLDQFDLVIFDRYTLRGVLTRTHLANLASFVVEGGAMLVSTGPEFAQPFSLFRTPLGQIMPAEPLGNEVRQGFQPRLSEIGLRHPVTAPFAQEAGQWGRWFRLIDAQVREGQILLTGPAERPLLVLSRVGEGRVAQILSDQIWLWARGIEGGGPHQAILRRTVHWLMKEPDLEEEALRATADGESALTVERRSLSDAPVEVSVEGPLGTAQAPQRRDVRLSQQAPGVRSGQVQVAAPGLYRVSDGTQVALVSVGDTGQEMKALVPRGDVLEPLVAQSGGGLFWLQDGVPDLRRVSGRGAKAGRDWYGIRRDAATQTVAVTQTPLLPPAAALALLAALLVLAWLRESR